MISDFRQVPKPGGVKKGWHRQFAVVCDFKVFLFDVTGERQPQISQSASQVLDMRYGTQYIVSGHCSTLRELVHRCLNTQTSLTLKSGFTQSLKIYNVVLIALGMKISPLAVSWPQT